ncbi:putative Protocatechuate 3,4-dioxygenase [Paraburkholderia piptadeniae]|uniref:Protocatechuate 3,4-dioxygenase n=1 Tax=Paraburkholderia piptadeniae TaxID=1701573 RepID=A0A1N7SL74_9BURK|nr:putative Protocatechuate 3,4-dioxygenase [Paraburkholderia piptadeniae]
MPRCAQCRADNVAANGASARKARIAHDADTKCESGTARFSSQVCCSAVHVAAVGPRTCVWAARRSFSYARCTDEHEPTRQQTAGPFFLPHSPQRASLLEPGIKGTKIVLTGRVYSTQCSAVPGALLDFWHANDAGEYDVEGFRLRGHQFADGEGRYRLETIVPGLYPGRTRHIHVTVRPPNGPILTTQLYFPGEQRNARDSLFDRRLLMTIDNDGELKAAPV